MDNNANVSMNTVVETNVSADRNDFNDRMRNFAKTLKCLSFNSICGSKKAPKVRAAVDKH